MGRRAASLRPVVCAAPLPDPPPSRPLLCSDAVPHVLFAGRQRAFGSRLVTAPDGTATRLLCVPEFASTHTAVLLDVSSPTLEAVPLTFAVGGLGRAGGAAAAAVTAQGLRLRAVR
jgi:hypothetical protein